ncbi:MAG TPA: HD domain-containing protein [Erysipelothrix sp.]|nr:HD domain-containing protein [Erysipelothrix sp.]
MSTKIKDFENGKKIEVPLLVHSVTKGVTQNGAPYLSIRFQDNTGTIEGKWWDVNPKMEEIVKAGTVGLVKCDVLLYRQNLQIRVHGFTKLDNYDLDEFVSASDYSKDFLKEQMKIYTGMIENPIYQTIVEACFEHYGEDFFLYPAATRNHHDFVGGLATHVYDMCRMAVSLKEIYAEIDLDLLLAGVLIHDMGKIDEYTQPILSQYSNEGRLLGHISIMHGHLYEIIKRLGLLDTEESMLLRHLVLSHHGYLEYGSPVRPMVKEAEILNFLDNLDARMNMFGKLLEETEEGTFSPREFALENRSFYKPKGVK